MLTKPGQTGYSFRNPPEPEQDLEITFTFIRRLKEINPATELILYTYTPVPADAGSGDLYERAKAAGVKAVCLDRGSFKYQGRVAALADAVREEGISV